MSEERAERLLDMIYDEVHQRLNPSGDECWHCGGDGYTYDCIDGCCIDVESGCEDCASRCYECALYKRSVTKAVRIEVLRKMDVDLAAAFLRREGRTPPAFAHVTLLNLHAGRSAHHEFSEQERAESACWVEGLL